MVCAGNSPVPARSECAGAAEKRRRTAPRRVPFARPDGRMLRLASCASPISTTYVPHRVSPDANLHSTQRGDDHRPTSGGHPPQLLTHSRVVVPPTQTQPAGSWPPHRPRRPPRRAPAHGPGRLDARAVPDVGPRAQPRGATRTCVFAKVAEAKKPLRVCVVDAGSSCSGTGSGGARRPGVPRSTSRPRARPRGRGAGAAHAGSRRRVVDDAKEKREPRRPFRTKRRPGSGTTSAVQRRGPPAHARVRAPFEPAWKERKYSVEPWCGSRSSRR